jgi:hypothetical protein
MGFGEAEAADAARDVTGAAADGQLQSARFATHEKVSPDASPLAPTGDTMSNYLVTFHPLSSTRAGRLACDRFGLPAYIDGSCRREPDLENPFPSITALCRAGKFAPRLEVNDRVLYMTIKMAHAGGQVGWGLIAALHVVETRASHRAAFDWYAGQNLPIPSNCMVLENRAIAANRTTGLPRDPSTPWVRWVGLGGGVEAARGTLRDWERGYWVRFRHNGAASRGSTSHPPRPYSVRVAQTFQGRSRHSVAQDAHRP